VSLHAVIPPVGRVIRFRGSTVDIAFPAGSLPPILGGLRLRVGAKTLRAEVQAHLDACTVRIGAATTESDARSV